MSEINPERYLKPLTFAQTVEARMEFDPDTLLAMLDFNTAQLARATDPKVITELKAEEESIQAKLDRLKF